MGQFNNCTHPTHTPPTDAELEESWKRNAVGAANSLVGQLASLRAQLHAVCASMNTQGKTSKRAKM